MFLLSCSTLSYCFNPTFLWAFPAWVHKVYRLAQKIKHWLANILVLFRQCNINLLTLTLHCEGFSLSNGTYYIVRREFRSFQINFIYWKKSTLYCEQLCPRLNRLKICCTNVFWAFPRSTKIHHRQCSNSVKNNWRLRQSINSPVQRLIVSKFLLQLFCAIFMFWCDAVFFITSKTNGTNDNYIVCEL